MRGKQLNLIFILKTQILPDEQLRAKGCLGLPVCVWVYVCVRVGGDVCVCMCGCDVCENYEIIN